MDTDKIKVLGAGLNAKEPNSEVSFHVTKPEKAVKVDSYAYKKQDAKAVHVRLVKIATSSNASKKLQFAVELAIEKEDGTENLVSGLKAPIMVTVLLPEDYLEIRKESDKLYGPDGKKVGTDLDDDEISLFITRLGTFTVKGSGSSSNPAPGRRSVGVQELFPLTRRAEHRCPKRLDGNTGTSTAVIRKIFGWSLNGMAPRIGTGLMKTDIW